MKIQFYSVIMVLGVLAAVSIAGVQRRPFVTRSQISKGRRPRIIDNSTTLDKSNGAHCSVHASSVSPDFISLDPLPDFAYQKNSRFKGSDNAFVFWLHRTLGLGLACPHSATWLGAPEMRMYLYPPSTYSSK